MIIRFYDRSFVASLKWTEQTASTWLPVRSIAAHAPGVRARMIPFGLWGKGTAVEIILVEVIRRAFIVVEVVIPLVGTRIVGPISEVVGSIAVVLILGIGRAG
jgi:hypothetical protein